MRTGHGKNAWAVATSALGPRELALAGQIWRKSVSSRWEIHQLTGLHPNLVGASIQKLLDAGLLREGPGGTKAGAGRPRVSLEIDDAARQVLGLSISPGKVSVQKTNLLGRPVPGSRRQKRAGSRKLIALAAQMLRGRIDANTLAVGVSVTGFVDPAKRVLLFSSAAPSEARTALDPIYEAARGLPLILDNDMHALSARWSLSQGNENEDILLVGLDDGRLGASMLIGGKPNRGCVTAGNELGHTRLAVETERCYCGQVGCLERIFSTAQLRRLSGDKNATLADSLKQFPESSASLRLVIDNLATGLANAVNFIRPAQLVLVGRFVSHEGFRALLEPSLRSQLLPGLRDRVVVSSWKQPHRDWGESAAWLALAHYFAETVSTAYRLIP